MAKRQKVRHVHKYTVYNIQHKDIKALEVLILYAFIYTCNI